MTEATYGVAGMMEWIALIPIGRNIVRVRFSGGSLTGFGVTPALFKTTNPAVMRMIEGSSYYRSGKIRLVSKRDGKDDESEEAEKPDSYAAAPQYDSEGAVTFSKERR